MTIRLLTVVILAFVLTSSNAQQPVHWTYKVEKKGPGLFLVSLNALVDNGWHIYAMAQPKEAVARPTRFDFRVSPLLSLQGNTTEKGSLFHYRNEAAGIAQDQYSGQVSFSQLVEVKAQVDTQLSIAIYYQACTDEECLPPEEYSLSVPLHNSKFSPN